MDIIVQKFGGTSLANENNRKKATNKIINKYNKGIIPVVVVSAIGRLGSPYSTDTLLSLVNNKKLSARDLDLLISCGEVISAIVLANLLNEKGYNTTVLTGFQAGIITDDNFNKAKVIKVNKEKLLNNIKENNITIIAGFQGATEKGEITTLGRGGSDTSALILGEALKCDTVEIYTDVNGIMTADPRIVPNAKTIKEISYNELYQLAEDGAKVIHPRAVEVAQRSKIEIKIKNTLNECAGTLVTTENEMTNNNSIIEAITYKNKRAQVIIKDDNKKINELMKDLASKNISIDLINFFIDKKVFTIDESDIDLIKDILTFRNYNFEIVRDCTKLSIIGHNMMGLPGVMAKIVNILYTAGIEILQTSDSHMTIWCLIKNNDTKRAVQLLHNHFLFKK
ncbi:MAG: aspartate kinase [Firmicutes bacterium]|nr:aspartate kinase [Bacillota bacterium]